MKRKHQGSIPYQTITSEPGNSSISTRVLRAWNPHIQITHIPKSLVEEYQKSDEKLEEFAIRYGLRGRAQLSQWIIRYNESILEDCRSGKQDSRMKGRKTTFDERLEIIEQLIRQKTCLCVKKRPDRRTVPQSIRILLVKILYLNCILDRT